MSIRHFIALSVAIVLFCMTAVCYGADFGAPSPVATEGSFSLGVGYWYGTAKMKPSNSGWSNLENRQNQVYLQASYSFIKDWEVYGRIGGADAQIKATDADRDHTPANMDMQPFGTIGVRGLLYQSGFFGIGPFVQASLYANRHGFIESTREDLKSAYDINAGIGMQATIGKVVVYGGPMAYWNRSKITETDAGISDTSTYKEKNNFGGFLGVRVPIVKGLALQAEGQYKSKPGAGATLTYSF